MGSWFPHECELECPKDVKLECPKDVKLEFKLTNEPLSGDSTLKDTTTPSSLSHYNQ